MRFSIDPKFPGIDIDDFQRGLVAAAASVGADAIAPVHGTPAGAGIADKAYTTLTTRGLVRRAHRAGLRVVPWTVDDRATMHHLIDAGVDGIVTDYPDRLRTVMTRGLSLPTRTPAEPDTRRCLP